MGHVLSFVSGLVFLVQFSDGKSVETTVTDFYRNMDKKKSKKRTKLIDDALGTLTSVFGILKSFEEYRLLPDQKHDHSFNREYVLVPKESSFERLDTFNYESFWDNEMPIPLVTVNRWTGNYTATLELRIKDSEGNYKNTELFNYQSSRPLTYVHSRVKGIDLFGLGIQERNYFLSELEDLREFFHGDIIKAIEEFRNLNNTKIATPKGSF